MASLHPEHGARMVLERASVEDSSVRYALQVYEPDELHEGEARITPDGVTLELASAPAWALTFLERLVKSLAKKHREDGDWPRKITRWRAP